MPARQRASNDKVLDGDLIANRNSSVKHKKGLVAENKRLFSQSHGGIRVRAIVRLSRERKKERKKGRKRRRERERLARPFNLHVYSPIPRSPPRRINSIVPMQPVCGGHHESRACADIGANDNGGEGRRTTRATR